MIWLNFTVRLHYSKSLWNLCLLKINSVWMCWTLQSDNCFSLLHPTHTIMSIEESRFSFWESYQVSWEARKWLHRGPEVHKCAPGSQMEWVGGSFTDLFTSILASRWGCGRSQVYSFLFALQDDILWKANWCKSSSNLDHTENSRLTIFLFLRVQGLK